MVNNHTLRKLAGGRSAVKSIQMLFFQLVPTFFKTGSHTLGYGLGVVVAVEILVTPSTRQNQGVPVAGAGHQSETDGRQDLSSQFPLEQTTQLGSHHSKPTRKKEYQRRLQLKQPRNSRQCSVRVCVVSVQRSRDTFP